MSAKLYLKKHRTNELVASYKQSQGKRKKKRLLPLGLMLVGVFLLLNAIWPILSYEIYTSPSLRAAEGIVEPVADAVETRNREYLYPTPKPTPVILSESLEYTDLSRWFPDKVIPLVTPEQAKKYQISIPKVGVEDATVIVGGSNLDRSLIQYPGTAMPGELGSPVIFGHSVLRQFYNPGVKNPRRYVSIFSKIMTLQKGDEILVKSDNVTYVYKVSTKTEVKPEDTFILEQHRDSKELKLVTCVPEGTYLRRGIITAILEE